MLGHELGHIAQGNLSIHLLGGLLESVNQSSAILGSLLSSVLENRIKDWCRESELIADQYGLICSGDLESSQSVIRKANRVEHRYSENLLELYDYYPIQRHRLMSLEQHALRIF